jgi:hypothetical protein
MRDHPWLFRAPLSDLRVRQGRSFAFPEREESG